MAINTINLASKMTGDLDKAVVQKAMTGFFADNALRAKFVGAATVLVPSMEFSGLGSYDRDEGFTRGAITVTNESYTLSMDRARSFQLDAQDCDEIGVTGLAGQVMGEFVSTQVVPELDAYCLSKLATLAVTNSQTVTGTPASQAYKMFTEAVSKVQGAVGYDEELVAFVNPTMWTAFQTTDELSRQITVSDFVKGGLNTRVKSINDTVILPVSDSRMKSKYTFYDGTTSGQTAGGFAAADDAQSIGLLVLPKRAASLVKKTETVRIFDPERNLNADAWKFDYRLYYDLFIRQSMEGGVYVYVY
ncbi:MAG TPA: hypothetical protein H9674_07380 [Firmicutes bacterium]|nr:hypothetical protein [Bacillota bacterium]